MCSTAVASQRLLSLFIRGFDASLQRTYEKSSYVEMSPVLFSPAPGAENGTYFHPLPVHLTRSDLFRRFNMFQVREAQEDELDRLGAKRGD